MCVKLLRGWVPTKIRDSAIDFPKSILRLHSRNHKLKVCTKQAENKLLGNRDSKVPGTRNKYTEFSSTKIFTSTFSHFIHTYSMRANTPCTWPIETHDLSAFIIRIECMSSVCPVWILTFGHNISKNISD